MSPEPNDADQKRSMKGWARFLADFDYPVSLAEAQLHATMASADRLVELVTCLTDIQNKLTRMEWWINARDPDYQKTHPSTMQLAPPEKTNEA